MKIVGIYSFNKGKEIIERHHPELITEIKDIISSIDASKYKIKKSKEKTMKGKMLFSPIKLNEAFKSKFKKATSLLFLDTSALAGPSEVIVTCPPFKATLLHVVYGSAEQGERPQAVNFDIRSWSQENNQAV